MPPKYMINFFDNCKDEQIGREVVEPVTNRLNDAHGFLDFPYQSPKLPIKRVVFIRVTWTTSMPLEHFFLGIALIRPYRVNLEVYEEKARKCQKWECVFDVHEVMHFGAIAGNARDPTGLDSHHEVVQFILALAT